MPGVRIEAIGSGSVYTYRLKEKIDTIPPRITITPTTKLTMRLQVEAMVSDCSVPVGTETAAQRQLLTKCQRAPCSLLVLVLGFKDCAVDDRGRLRRREESLKSREE
jgi:hypothetical protein